MLVKIESREDPDQTASDLGLHSLSRSFWQVSSVSSNFSLLYKFGLSCDWLYRIL